MRHQDHLKHLMRQIEDPSLMCATSVNKGGSAYLGGVRLADCTSKADRLKPGLHLTIRVCVSIYFCFLIGSALSEFSGSTYVVVFKLSGRSRQCYFS